MQSAGTDGGKSGGVVIATQRTQIEEVRADGPTVTAEGAVHDGVPLIPSLKTCCLIGW